MMEKIVYIDDEPLLCRVIQRILEAQGAAVVTFTDPLAAIAYIADHPVAAVICDYRMPTLTGLQVLDRIERAVPFFLVSGDLAVEPRIKQHPRITGLLTKPFAPETLIDLVWSSLGEPTR